MTPSDDLVGRHLSDGYAFLKISSYGRRFILHRHLVFLRCADHLCQAYCLLLSYGLIEDEIPFEVGLSLPIVVGSLVSGDLVWESVGLAKIDDGFGLNNVEVALQVKEVGRFPEHGANEAAKPAVAGSAGGEGGGDCGVRHGVARGGQGILENVAVDHRFDTREKLRVRRGSLLPRIVGLSNDRVDFAVAGSKE